MRMNSRFPGNCTKCGCSFPAGTEIDFIRGVGASHSTPRACHDAKTARLALENRDGGAHLDMKPIVQFLEAAKQRGLKSPKLRVLDPTGKLEIRLSLTRSGVAPGSLSIVLDQNYVGAVRPDGKMAGAIAVSSELQKHLLQVAKDPQKAAHDYAALMCVCSFCGKPLVDAGSVECGYGPVCAKHWGLPHTALGTSVLVKVQGRNRLIQLPEARL